MTTPFQVNTLSLFVEQDVHGFYKFTINNDIVIANDQYRRYSTFTDQIKILIGTEEGVNRQPTER
jgi:hypothetical protein